MNYNDFLSRSPDIGGGPTKIRGTWVRLGTVLGSLAEGNTFENLLAAFPAITPDHLRAANTVLENDTHDTRPLDV